MGIKNAVEVVRPTGRAIIDRARGLFYCCRRLRCSLVLVLGFVIRNRNAWRSSTKTGLLFFFPSLNIARTIIKFFT